MTDWKRVLEENRDKITQEMIYMHKMAEGATCNNALGINSEGTLFNWQYVGNYSEPELVWNGTDLCIKVFKPWDWTDCVDDFNGAAIAYTDDDKKELLRQRIAEEKERHMLGATTYEILMNEFPHVLETIEEIVIDEEVNAYRGEVDGLLDEIIARVAE